MGPFRPETLCCLFPKVLMMSSDFLLNSWCVTVVPRHRHPGLPADILSLCCSTWMAAAHPGTLRQEGKVGKRPARLGRSLGFLAGWFITTAFGRKRSAGTLTTASRFPCIAGVWAFALIGTSYTILRLNALSGKING